MLKIEGDFKLKFYSNQYMDTKAHMLLMDFKTVGKANNPECFHGG